MRILISVCGEGFGHTTRCLAVGEELSKEHEVKFIAYGKSMEYIRKCNYEVFETYPEIKLSGYEGRFDIKGSIFNSGHKPTEAIKRELKIVKRYKPDLIIIDCKYSTALIAKLLNIPFYVITNQNYTRSKDSRRFIVYPVMRFLNIINRRAKGVIIPDLPMPYTVCEYNLTMLNNLHFIGPLIRYNVEDYEDDEEEDYILSVIGGFEYRYRILELLNEVSKRRGIKVKMVCGSYEVAEKLRRIKAPNVEIIPFTTNMEDLIRRCSFIVCHGGHSTLMEAISFGKPVITIPDLYHPEQENNSKKIGDLKCGIALSHMDLEDTLEWAIDEIMSNPIYFRNARRLRELCKFYNGRKNIREIVNRFEREMRSKDITSLLKFSKGDKEFKMF